MSHTDSHFPQGERTSFRWWPWNEYVQWRTTLLPKGPQKGILTPQSPNPKPNHLKLPTRWEESCMSGEQDGLAQSHSQT